MIANLIQRKVELPPEERILLAELAKKKCSYEKVEETLTAGADPNCENKDKLTPIALGKFTKSVS